MTSDWLLRFLLASAASSALVLLFRPALRRLCGAGSAYLSWACVPACMLAALVPQGGRIEFAALPLAAPAVSSAEASQITHAAVTDWSSILLAAWLAGALLMASWMAWRQWTFQRSLRHTPWQGGPLLLGVWRARLVLPATFRRDYDKAERRLVLAHERIHAERGDLLANTVCALLQCLAWCNLLIHLAAARFRLDQELSCDEAVLRRHGQAATYANAMLKTQLAAQGLPLACQWQAVHPLKERIMQLKSTVSSARRLGGKLAAALLLAASSVAGLSAHADTAVAKRYYIQLEVGGATPALLVDAGGPGSVKVGQGADAWSASFVVEPKGTEVRVKTKVSVGDTELNSFTLGMANGERGRFRVSDGAGKNFEGAMRVTEVK
ncbi:energy transducer TonB [Pseudoduganella sp. DS3]|uniref:Energy transducer TonB n=1 Tax=Pseudoduganella guangdongensis TaxID=2692179 RepID=A0A6N9HBD6_9BURK|nr:M56 family metallopeptidase [Pseudoduganella guangdongensis]MYN00804.1 energy transducer TonB [Pseudoduganella guangdongensis]